MTTRTLIVAAALAVAAGGWADEQERRDEPDELQQQRSERHEQVKVAFVYPTTTTNFAQEMALGAKAAAGDTPGVSLTESAPAEVNGPKQVQLFQAAARTSKDGVAMMTLTPDCSSARSTPPGRTCRSSPSTSRRCTAPRRRSSC
jgi:ribose transport system substrate-binding protein